MATRRALVSGGLAALTAAVAGRATAADAAPLQENDEGMREIANAIRSLAAEIRRPQCSADCAALDALNQAQRAFLKSNQKFPDFIDVGYDVWQAAYEWHVVYRLPLVVQRLRDGRYTLRYRESTLVLRPDSLDSYVGSPYDTR